MKSTTSNKRNLWRESPEIETKLDFKTGMTRAMLSGVKRVTIRIGKRKFSNFVDIHGYKAQVQWFKHTTLLHVNFDILKDHGYKTMFETLVRIKEHYPEIDLNTPITVVGFRVMVP